MLFKDNDECWLFQNRLQIYERKREIQIVIDEI
jgi:hypothetical protein